MTQFETMRALIADISRQLTPIRSNVDKLRAVLEDAQNQPPQGMSDGSIAPEDWTTTTNMVVHATELMHTTNWLIRHFEDSMPAKALPPPGSVTPTGPRLVGYRKSKKHKAACEGCSAVIEYVDIDVKRTPTSHTGESCVDGWIKCPSCESDVRVECDGTRIKG